MRRTALADGDSVFDGRVRRARYVLPRYEGYEVSVEGHDPAWGVAEIRRAVADPAAPLRLPLGRDAIGRIRAKLSSVGAELEILGLKQN